MFCMWYKHVFFQHVSDLRSIFEVLREYKLRLNASKCSFGISLGKVLGCMVIHRGIEVNHDQIKEINDLQSPWNPKEVQKLTGMTAALNRFISWFVDRCRPFFQLSHKWKGFEWNEECTLPFQQLKDYLSRPPIMFRLEEEQVPFTYIFVASHAVILVLVRVENGVQAASLLCEQVTTRSESSLLTLRESHFCSGACYTKTPLLFSSPYSCDFNSTPFAVVALKGWLYRENCQVMDDFGGIWH